MLLRLGDKKQLKRADNGATLSASLPKYLTRYITVKELYGICFNDGSLILIQDFLRVRKSTSRVYLFIFNSFGNIRVGILNVSALFLNATFFLYLSSFNMQFSLLFIKNRKNIGILFHYNSGLKTKQLYGTFILHHTVKF